MQHGPLRTTWPPTRVNDDMPLTPEQWILFLKHKDRFVGKYYKDPLISGHSNEKKSRFLAPWLSQGLIYLVTETVAEYPHAYFTEKTWRAIFSFRPFMLVAPRHSLKKLREFGFLTFDRWWDESYDMLDTAADRTQSLVAELSRIAQLSVDEQQNMLEEMRPILIHNRQHLDVFMERDLACIEKML